MIKTVFLWGSNPHISTKTLKVPIKRHFLCVPSMALNLAVKVRYGGTYQPTISEAQAIRREARSGDSV